MGESYPLNGEQKNQLINLVESPLIAPDFARTGKKNPNLKVFVVHFDGTQNDRENVPDGESETLVSKSFAKHRASSDGNIRSRYYRGVGTTKLPITRLIQSATGMGCISNAEQAHADLVKQSEAWRLENPRVEIHVHVVGFSRGSATALHFLNLVDQRGAVSENEEAMKISSNFKPGRVQTSAALLDTVSTGQSDRLNLTLPKSCVAVLHLVANDEQRGLFPVQQIDPTKGQEIAVRYVSGMDGLIADMKESLHYRRVQEAGLPGVHSDIGGSYKDGGISKVSEFLLDRFQQSLGLPIDPRRPSVEEIQNCRMHDSRFAIEKLMGGAKPGKVDKRLSEEVQSDTWNGDWVMSVEMNSSDATPKADIGSKLFAQYKTSLDDVYDNAYDKGAARPYLPAGLRIIENFKELSDQMMGKPISVVINPTLGSHADDSHALKEGAEVLASFSDGTPVPSGAVEMRPDGLYILGGRAPGVPRLDAMQNIWLAQKNAGIEPTPVCLSSCCWRVGAYAKSSQDPNVKTTPLPPVEPDPWPQAVCKAIVFLNQDPTLSEYQASKIMHFSARESSQLLASEIKGLASVSITPIKEVLRMGNEAKLVNRFAIEAKDAEGRVYSTEIPPRTLAERDAHQMMKVIARGLSEVGSGLLKAGFIPQIGLPMEFEALSAKKMPGGVIMESKVGCQLPPVLSKDAPLPTDFSAHGALQKRLVEKRGHPVSSVHSPKAQML